MAQKQGSQFSAPKQNVTAAGAVGERRHGSGGSYAVTLDANPSVEQVQNYTTKTLTPTSYVPSPSEFDFMSSSSSLGSPTGMLLLSFRLLTKTIHIIRRLDCSFMGAIENALYWPSAFFRQGKSFESVQCAITGPCLRMRHRPSA